MRLAFEPGRVIAANAGLLLSRVIHVHERPEGRRFLVLDAAMNDLIRPAMYDSFNDIRPVMAPLPGAELSAYDVVGPVCESGDWIGRDRALNVQPGDVLAVLSAGAYCMSMASNYNSRGRAAEILVDGAQVHLIRERESVFDTFQLEHLPA